MSKKSARRRGNTDERKKGGCMNRPYDTTYRSLAQEKF